MGGLGPGPNQDHGKYESLGPQSPDPITKNLKMFDQFGGPLASVVSEMQGSSDNGKFSKYLQTVSN